MKKIILILFTINLIFNSCVYTKHPFAYKLTRGDWERDTYMLKFNELPIKIKDTLTFFYKRYYKNDSLFLPELISLDSNVSVSFIERITFPSETIFLHTPGYYFKIGSKIYFFDYRKYQIPIIYYENTLYYFSGKYSLQKDRYTHESKSDYENKMFVEYKLKTNKKHWKVSK